MELIYVHPWLAVRGNGGLRFGVGRFAGEEAGAADGGQVRVVTRSREAYGFVADEDVGDPSTALNPI